jgi:3',5'-cyclic AMP phosphodiesterase CpdA
MSTITWLHLSDFHFRAGERHTWDEDIVLRALLDDVRARMEDGLTPDVILVSGEIAFSGAPAEYALARQFFNDLLEVTDVPKTRLFTVPGNHDVDRQAISRGAKAIASSLDSRQAVDEVLTGSITTQTL